jgi:hypothetical protein
VYNNSTDISIGPPDQFPKFFTDDLFGTDVRAKHHQLHQLTSVITTPRYTAPGIADFNFFFTPIVMGKFCNDFKLIVRIQHTREDTLGASDLLELKEPLHTVVRRLQSKNICVSITHEHVHLPTWNVTNAIALSEMSLLETLRNMAAKVSARSEPLPFRNIRY